MSENSIRINPEGNEYVEAASRPKKYRFLALSPLLVFVTSFVGVGIFFTLQGYEKAFYQISPTVLIMPAIMLAFILSKNSIAKTIEQFLCGSGHPNVMNMCFIYLLAGAFGYVATAIGAVESTVNLALTFLSPKILLPGILVTTAFISISMGSAMGTIAAMAPIALGIATAAGISPALMMGVVVGGSMFGDNLSMISDTTIASVQTQGCRLKDKFIFNARIAIPAAVITLVVLLALGHEGKVVEVGPYQLIKILPYASVLCLALMGLDVLVVLVVGIVISGVIGFGTMQDFTILAYTNSIFEGFSSMREIFILSMLIGGLAELVRIQGGIAYLIDQISKVTRAFSKKEKSPVIGELSICCLVSIADICTAINTVAILITGDAAKRIAKKHQISPVRTAGFLDIFSCVFQGILPYSAQILLAGALAGVSPLEIVANVHYCFILGVLALGSVVFQSIKR